MENNDKKFGMMWSSFFIIYGGYKFLHDQIFSGSATIGIGLLLMTISVAAPYLYRPLTSIWIKLGDTLQKITTPIFLGIIFYTIVFPIGFTRSLVEKNNFKLQYDSNVDSYWETEASNAESTLKTQF